MQRRWLGERAGSGFEEVGDVVAGERAVFEGVVECARGGIGTVDLTERDDFAHMMDGVEAAVREFAVILVGAGGERDEALEQALGGGLAALFEQGAGMVGMLEVAVSLVASRVAGEETVVVVDAQPVGIALQGQALRGVLGGHGIAIGVEGDAEAIRGAHGVHGAEVVEEFGERSQLVAFESEQVEGTLVGLAVDAHVGDGVEPLACGGVIPQSGISVQRRRRESMPLQI